MTTRVDYGPQHEQVVALLDRLRAMTAAQARSLPDVRVRQYAAEAKEARGRLFGNADDLVSAPSSVLADAILAAVETVDIAATATGGSITPRWDRVGGDEWAITTTAATNAVIGLVLRHLIHDADYRTLTWPLANLFGPLHPDDETEEAS